MPEELAATAHQFEDLAQQHEADELGMWVFLGTEVMFFGGLFLGYTVYRHVYFGAFEAGSHLLDLLLGAVNTSVLIASSFTMALSVYAAQKGRKKTLITCLILTMILGSVFLGIKGVEYGQKFHHHLVPGYDFNPEGNFPAHMSLYFSFYFIMTGMHALHMIVGEGLLLVVLILAAKNRFTAAHHATVEVVGIYWHFVDIIWIFLFPLLYLIGGR
ncbi:MAG: cytochrome c oxidase subunit 3 family protein [Acidobacteriia bacterium]|nr:cytochrome c oxidase subunit 3 family protein [Terriglobia bacterium]